MDGPPGEAAAIGPDNRFVPVRAEALAAALEGDQALSPVASRAVEVLSALERVIGQEISGLQRVLTEMYSSTNPDRETVEDCGASSLRALLDALHYALDKANYEALDESSIDAAIAVANSQGLRIKVEAEAVAMLRLYVRGRGAAMRTRRTVRAPFRGRTQELETYRRLVTVWQLRGEERVWLRLFRDIPVADVEALLPHARVSMSFFDKAQVFGSGAGALGGLATKLSPILAGTAIATNTLAWPAILAFGGLSLKSFLGYRRAHRHRTSQRTHNLFESTLGVNATVISAVLGQVAQEEVKEALLCLCFLPEGELDEAELDARIEAWLERRFGVRVNFDCPDGLETLRRLGLTGEAARDPAAVVERLHGWWRAERSIGYHVERARGVRQEGGDDARVV